MKDSAHDTIYQMMTENYIVTGSTLTERGKF